MENSYFFIIGQILREIKIGKNYYRISSNNVRGYYSFLSLKSAASIWGRPLLKGGYYIYFLCLATKMFYKIAKNDLNVWQNVYFS